MEGERGSSGGRRRVTLLDQMSAGSDCRDLAGLSLDDILGKRRPVPTPPPPPPGRTLLDIIKDEEPKSTTFKGFSAKDRKAWKSFKDRLRIKRAGTAWTSSNPVPTFDIPFFFSNNSLLLQHTNFSNTMASNNPHHHHHSSADDNISAVNDMPPPPPHHHSNSAGAAAGGARPLMARRGSTRFADDAPTRTQPSSRRLSVRFADEGIGDQTDPPLGGSRRLSAALAEERSMSAREAVAAQEAAEAEAAAAAAAAAAEDEDGVENEDDDGEAAAEGEGEEPVKMSLMDLMGSRYMMGDEDDEDEEEEDEEEMTTSTSIHHGQIQQIRNNFWGLEYEFEFEFYTL